MLNNHKTSCTINKKYLKNNLAYKKGEKILNLFIFYCIFCWKDYMGSTRTSGYIFTGERITSQVSQCYTWMHSGKKKFNKGGKPTFFSVDPFVLVNISTYFLSHDCTKQDMNVPELWDPTSCMEAPWWIPSFIRCWVEYKAWERPNGNSSRTLSTCLHHALDHQLFCFGGLHSGWVFKVCNEGSRSQCQPEDNNYSKI